MAAASRSKQRPAREPKMVLEKYKMFGGPDDLLGEGTSSIAWRGQDMSTGKEVAIKVYKNTGRDGHVSSSTLKKFVRQIEVLQELMRPFVIPADASLWNDRLAKAKPSRLFLELLDYSKDTSGKPGLDPKDKTMYVVTELGQYSLKDYLHHRHEQRRPLSHESVRNITEALILVMAGLHAKGLVHIDFKPENVMMFNGRLKLIDVDGCVRVGSQVAITDSSISFSPCYCAPEWARFLIDESDSHITISPALDVWSVGMTICELVTLDPVLKPMYASFLRNGSRAQQEAGFLFMEWLSSCKKTPIPRAVEKFDPQFHDLVANHLLVFDKVTRVTMARSLAHGYIAPKPKAAAQPGVAQPVAPAPAPSPPSDLNHGDGPDHEVDPTVVRKHAPRLEEEVAGGADRILHHGALWKLNTGGHPADAAQWLMRDMWINAMGNLCYFSQKEHRRLVLVDAHKMSSALIDTMNAGTARDFAFKLTVPTDGDDHGPSELVFAAETDDDRNAWISFVRRCARMEFAKTMKLGADMAKDLQEFKLMVRNRRMKVDHDSRFDALFKGKLWKVKSDGDKMKPEDWFQRDMWLAKNGSLVYWSAKEDRELVYYTAQDVGAATLVIVDNTASAKPWTFQVCLPEVQGMQFAPGEFAAESETARDEWLNQLTSHGARVA